MLVSLIHEGYRLYRIDGRARVPSCEELLFVVASIGARAESIVDAIRAEESALDYVPLRVADAAKVVARLAAIRLHEEMHCLGDSFDELLHRLVLSIQKMIRLNDFLFFSH